MLNKFNKLVFDNNSNFNLKKNTKEIYEVHHFANDESNEQNQRKKVIECISLNKVITTSSYSSVILTDINLDIDEGEIVIILGPSGSGKTTLLNMISGMDKPTSGDVIVYDQVINKLSDKELTKLRKEKISYIYQRYGLVPISTVFDNIKLGEYLVEPSQRKNINFDYIIEKTGLNSLLSKFPHELSGGQKQRVSIARAIMKQPKLMLCDEPTGALDDETSKKVIDLFLWINEEFNTTIVMVTHNNDLVRIADKIIYIKDGKIDKIVKK